MNFKRVKGYYYDLKRVRYYRRFFATIGKSGLPHKGRVIIYAGIPQMYLSPFEILLYHYFKCKGYNVEYLVYGPECRYHELVTVANSGDINSFIAKNYRRGTKFLRAAGVDFRHIKVANPLHIEDILDRLNTLDDIFCFTYEKIPFGTIVRRVVYRYYKSLSVDNKPNVLEVAKGFMKTALENYFCFKESSDGLDMVLMSHGIYCTWEPILFSARANEIKVIAYDRAKTASTINININQPSPDWSFSAAWEHYVDRALTPFEEDQVNTYLAERELQKNDVFAYNFKAKSVNSASVRDKLGLKMSDKVIVFFTNLVWDAANVDRDEVFESFDQAIVETAIRFRDQPDVKVLVRTHPAERVLGTNLRFQDMLPYDDGYVQVIDENLEINSFDIIEMADIGVVHTSTVGLEMAIEGKPVLLLGNTHYKSKEFTLDPISVDDYFSKLQGLIEGDSKFEEKRAGFQKLARKYFFMMMFLYQHKLPIKYVNNEFEAYEHASFNELFDQNEVVRKLVDRILDPSSKHLISWE